MMGTHIGQIQSPCYDENREPSLTQWLQQGRKAEVGSSGSSGSPEPRESVEWNKTKQSEKKWKIK